MGVWERWQEMEEYDRDWPRDADGHAVGAKQPSGYDRWDDWPDDVRELLRHWNRSQRLSFRGGYFGWYRVGLQGRYRQRVAGFDWTQAVFRCLRCGAPTETHRYGRAELDGRAYCDDCLIELARAWQAGTVGYGKALDDLARWLKKRHDDLARELGLNPKTARRWLRGQEPQAKDGRHVLQLHAVASALVTKLGEREARHWLKARWHYVIERDLHGLTDEAEPILIPRSTRRSRASTLSDLEPGALGLGDYEPTDLPPLPLPGGRRRATPRRRT